jgi:DNA-binding NarL/FixJ family response regulator
LQSEAAAQRGVAQHIGGRVLISCLEEPDGTDAQQGAERVGELSPREYNVLSRIVQGWNYDSIAADLDISVSTVRTHLNNVYETLCPGRDGEEAASFIPMEERSLSVVSLYTVDGNGEEHHKLSEIEREICDALIAGSTRQQIALSRRVANSTVRTHLHNIYANLGIDRRSVDRPGVILRRLTAGTANLNSYYRMLEKVATGLQPKVVSMLQPAEVEQLENRVSGILADTEKRPKLLRPLETRGYVEPGAVSGSSIDLAGLMAAGLLLNRGYRDVMLHDQTAPLAREVIRGETNHYLRGDNS